MGMSTVSGVWCISAVVIMIRVSPLFMQIFTTVACRLLFIAGKRAQLKGDDYIEK